MAEMAEDVLEQLRAARIVPVVTLDDAADAVPLTEALVGGGLPVVEITLRTDAGLDALRAAGAAAIPGAVVGAGTVLTPEDAEAAIDAGARFIVSPCSCCPASRQQPSSCARSRWVARRSSCSPRPSRGDPR